MFWFFILFFLDGESVGVPVYGHALKGTLWGFHIIDQGFSRDRHYEGTCTCVLNSMRNVKDI